MSAVGGPVGSIGIVRTSREHQLVGLEALAAATALLQRVRSAHPTAGLYEAADLQWWWRTPRSTDDDPQLFWFDDDGRPAAAVVGTDWRDRVALAFIVLPGTAPGSVVELADRGLAHAADVGWSPITVEVDPADVVAVDALARHGFTSPAAGVVESWLAASDRPAVRPLPGGYRLVSRPAVTSVPHHMAGRSGPDVEARLRQTSLYRSELDLVVLGTSDDVAAYGLFWFDPTTATGLVEPMHTEAPHRRRGLARHILTSGIARLAHAGATRIKICHEPDNLAAGDLYRSVGFQPLRETVVFTKA